MSRLDTIAGKIDYLRELIHQTIAQGIVMSAELNNLKAQVAHNADVDQSAITLIQGLADQIVSLKDDPAALADLANQLQAQADSLAAAVVANTPSAGGGTGNDTTGGGTGNDTVNTGDGNDTVV